MLSLYSVKLTDEQKEAVARWADEDEITLGEIQKRLKTEFSISVTYLETRFLLEDHGIELKPEIKPEPEDELDEIESILDDDEGDGGSLLGDGKTPPGGKVSISLDKLVPPHAMVSGKVTFSDGKRADWFIDQMGRLSLDPATPGYRPSQSDILAFQTELQRVMGRM